MESQESLSEKISVEKNSDEDIADNPAHAAHSLTPLSLIVHSITNLRRFIFPLAAITYGVSTKLSPFYLLIALPIILIISFVLSYWAWRRFTYHIGAAEIRIESGILSRNARSIPYERIQDVSIEQKLLPRLLGITAVKFETGSGGADEGTLEFVSLDEAENLRRLIRARKKGAITGDTILHSADGIVSKQGELTDAIIDYSAENKEDEIIYAMDFKRIFILGTFNFSLLIFAIVAGAVQQFDFLLPGDIGDAVDYFIASFDENSSNIQSISVTMQILSIAAFLVSIIIIGMLSGQLQTFLREYGFTLTQTERGIRRRRGLITLTDVVMPLHRVQAAIVQTGAIRKRFGWYALKFTSLGSDSGSGANGVESSHMIAPLAKDDEYWPLALRADIRAPSQDIMFERPHISYIIASILLGLGIAIISIIPAIINPDIIPLQWLWIAGILPIIFGLLNWRYHYHAMDYDQIYIKSGWWNQKMTILPMIKVQSVDISQGPIVRIFNMAHVTFGIAGGSGFSTLTIYNIPMNSAQNMRAHCIKSAKTLDFSKLIKAPT